MDRILTLKPSGITAHKDAVYGLCLKETFPRSMALRAPFGVYQSRTIVPLKMWLLRGNDAAMGAFFFFFSKATGGEIPGLRREGSGVGGHRKCLWLLLGLRGPVRGAGLAGSAA